MGLTVLSSLLRKYNIDPNSIGRLEVGTETLIDKSKSVKTVLMRLFGDNHNIEGLDTMNACYGGTNALFNTVNWIESSAWDGRDAIVVAGDIAIYKKGVARATGGAGCVAMLIGPNAPVVIEPGLRGSYFQDTYDFYKPDFSTEYPIVNGQYSIICYLRALDHCYAEYTNREQTMSSTSGIHSKTNSTVKRHEYASDRFDFLCFHTPMQKMAVKAYSRLIYNDIIADSSNPAFAEILKALPAVDYESSLTDKTLEYKLRELVGDRFQQHVEPATKVTRQCGNTYTGSVYCGICSLISTVSDDDLQGKRIGVFSYGSGLASSLFSLKVVGSVQQLRERLDVHHRLQSRISLSPEEYEKVMLRCSIFNILEVLKIASVWKCVRTLTNSEASLPKATWNGSCPTRTILSMWMTSGDVPTW